MRYPLASSSRPVLTQPSRLRRSALSSLCPSLLPGFACRKHSCVSTLPFLFCGLWSLLGDFVLVGGGRTPMFRGDGPVACTQ